MSGDSSKSLTASSAAPGKLEDISARDLCRCSSSEARKLIPFALCEKLNFLPLGVFGQSNKKVLSCAVSGEITQERIKEIKFATEMDVVLQSVSATALKEAIFTAYHGDSDLLARKASQLRITQKPQAKIEDFLHRANGDAAQYLAALIEYAIARGASDLHLAPRIEGAFARIRVDNQLLTQCSNPVPLALHDQMVSRIKVLSKLDPALKTRGQDGAFWLTIMGRRVHVRCSTIPTLHGEMAALRFLGVGDIPDLKNLGLLERPRQMFMEALNRRAGVILFVGPTGSGKSTTMYSAVKELSQRNLNIVTVEDPVEVQLPGISQISVNEKQGITFENSLRSVLRHDPDVILVGEIRDKASAKIAFEAGLTGHLLLTTTHARSAFEVFVRLAGLGLDLTAVSEAVSLIVCQRLLPKLCSKCKVVDLIASKRLGTTVHRGVGCSTCDYSGFLGRVLIAETLAMNQKLRDTVARGIVTSLALMDCASGDSYWGLTNSLETRLRAGEISWEQLVSFIEAVSE